MRQIIAALVAGLLFGLGLTISSMIDPAKVLAFLDVTGAWDPSLLFVLGGAVIVSFIGTQLIQRRLPAPALAEKFHWPDATKIDGRLIAGSAIFGVGWGLVGLCPGPALAALAIRPRLAGIFVLAMLAGMALHYFIDTRRKAPAAAAA